MKTILITGASSGIGRETAILFANKGWNVAATMRNEEHFSQFTNYKNIRNYLLDVKDPVSIEKAINQAIQDFGSIDVIVNNAGIYTTNPLEETSAETINNIIETNIKGVIHSTKTILKHFRKNKSGMIVNVSSIAGRVTFPFQSIYHTSKWAIEGFSESLYYELKPLKIKVKVVEPGMVKTNIYDSVLNFPFGQYPEEYRTRFERWHSYLMNNYKNGYSPRLDANTIFKAVNSNSSRLRRDTPVQFINDDIKTFNKYIEEGRYFYTQIKEEGIILYNSGKFKLARRRKLNFEEIKEQAQEYFDEKFKTANVFLEMAKFSYTKDSSEFYKNASFQLHQACENYYYAIRLSFTLRNNKQHNLSKLSGSVKKYADELKTVFPQDTPEEKRLFTLLKAAYVDARYNPHFVVTKEDIDALIPKVELLRDITKKICEVRIKEYGEKTL